MLIEDFAHVLAAAPSLPLATVADAAKLCGALAGQDKPLTVQVMDKPFEGIDNALCA